ncbi:MAG: hypothetical protein ACK4YP_11410, partial [Myxococcota bacterium]
VAARPAAPEPAPPPPSRPAPPPRGDTTAVQPPPPLKVVAPVDVPPIAKVAGFPWLVQAALLVLTIVGLVLCAPMGGVFSLVSARSESVEQVSLLRGVALTESLANRNAQPLADQRGLALDTTFLLERAGVRTAMVADKTGVVMAPAEKLRTSVAGLPAYTEASKTGDVATAGIDEGLYQIAVPIRAQVGGAGPRQIVGYALVDYDPAAVTEEVGSPIVGAVAGFAVAGLVAALVVGGGWWLVLRPLVALREETELALLGDQHDVVSPVRLPQMEQLAHSINRLVARARASGGPRR